MIEIRYLPASLSICSPNAIRCIGSEHCCIEFIQEVKCFISTQSANDVPIRVVTPKVDQINLTYVLALLDLLTKKFNIDAIIVNDLGILHHLRNSEYNIVIGRVLIGSFGYRYSLDHFIDPQENPLVVANALAPSILHKEKIELFKACGASAVEICPLRNEPMYIKELQSMGMRIHIHHASYLSALSKVCYTPEISCGYFCSHRCLTPKKLSLAHINGYIPISRSSMTEADFERKQHTFPNFYLIGNSIYYIDDKTKYTLEYYDSFVYDYRLFHDCLNDVVSFSGGLQP